VKLNKGVISGLVGIAMLAMPLTASANPYRDNVRYNRGYVSAARPAFAQRTTFAPRAAMAPVTPQVNFNARANANRGTWMQGPNPASGFNARNNYLRDYRNYDRPGAYAYNQYPPNYYQPNYYQPNYYQPAYAAPYANYAAPYANYAQPQCAAAETGYAPMNEYYGAPAMGGGLAGLLRQREGAQILYGQAVRAGNHTRAKHLMNDIASLNRQIANAENRSGVRAYGNPGLGYNAPYANSRLAYNTPYANSSLFNPNQYSSLFNSNQYGGGYGNMGGLSSMMGPLLGNYIH